MINLIGILIVILGFFAPFILTDYRNTFLYRGYGPAIYFFWIGFFLILNPLEKYGLKKEYAKWGRIAIIANIALYWTHFAYAHILINLNIMEGFNITLILLLKKICNPIRAIFDAIISVPAKTLDNGAIQFTYSYVRAMITDFFNILLFIIVGISTKLYLKNKITSRWCGTARTSPPHS